MCHTNYMVVYDLLFSVIASIRPILVVIYLTININVFNESSRQAQLRYFPGPCLNTCLSHLIEFPIKATACGGWKSYLIRRGKTLVVIQKRRIIFYRERDNPLSISSSDWRFQLKMWWDKDFVHLSIDCGRLSISGVLLFSCFIYYISRGCGSCFFFNLSSNEDVWAGIWRLVWVKIIYFLENSNLS